MKHFSTEKKNLSRAFLQNVKKDTLYHYYLIHEKTVHPNFPNLCAAFPYKKHGNQVS